MFSGGSELLSQTVLWTGFLFKVMRKSLWKFKMCVVVIIFSIFSYGIVTVWLYYRSSSPTVFICSYMQKPAEVQIIRAKILWILIFFSLSSSIIFLLSSLKRTKRPLARVSPFECPKSFKWKILLLLFHYSAVLPLGKPASSKLLSCDEHFIQ